MDPKELELFVNQLYDMGLDDGEVASKVSELEASKKTARRQEAPRQQKQPGLLSPQTAFPNTAAAIGRQGPLGGDVTPNQWADGKILPGLPMGFRTAEQNKASETQERLTSVAVGLGADVAGASYRLAGSLIPSRLTRGAVADPATGEKRTRTFKEALQNPQGSLATGGYEAVEGSNLPTPVKTGLTLALGAAEGFGVGAIAGAARSTVRSVLTKAAAPVAGQASNAAQFVQNVRMGITQRDGYKGASAANAMKHGIGNKTLKNALPIADEKINTWSRTRDAIYQKKPFRKVTAGKALDDIEGEIKSTDFGKAPRLEAITEIRSELQNFLNSTNKTMIREKKPDGRIVPNLTLQEADKFKAWLQEAGANFGKGMPKESKVSERVYRDVYERINEMAKDYGGAEYQKLNKSLSELIPVRDVIARKLKGASLGSGAVTKAGFVQGGLNLGASAVGLNRGGATLVYKASEGIMNAAKTPVSSAARYGLSAGAHRGSLKGSLLSGTRDER